VVEAVFTGEKVFGVLVTLAFWCVDHALVKTNDITAGTECFFAFGVQPDGGDVVVLLPVS